MDVSRETAVAAFGAALPQAKAYAEMLATDGVTRGLIGPREAGRLWSRHLLNSVGAVGCFRTTGDIADIGSGAGLPGIPLALLRPTQRFRLVEPLLRRATFLEDVVRELGLTNVEVIRARAEDLHGRWTVPTVTARAVAPLDRLVTWCLPLVARGGELLALKGARAGEELQAANDTLRSMGAESWSVDIVPSPDSGDLVRVVRITMPA